MRKPLPRDLLVMRHGKSDRGAAVPRDFDRPLARRGRRDARRMGRWLAGEGLLPDLVLASPAVRARDTAERAAEASGIRFDPRLYDASVDVVLQVLGEVPSSVRRVLIVGHNPSLEDLVHHLGGDAVEVPEDGKVLPTAAVARFGMPADWGSLPRGVGTLRWIRRPRDL
jgi:phosphohistidine phosphatase